jgi:hypothetical protein
MLQLRRRHSLWTIDTTQSSFYWARQWTIIQQLKDLWSNCPIFRQHWSFNYKLLDKLTRRSQINFGIRHLFSGLEIKYGFFNGISKPSGPVISWTIGDWDHLLSRNKSTPWRTVWSYRLLWRYIRSFMSPCWSLIESLLFLEECRVRHLVSKSKTTRNTR